MCASKRLLCVRRRCIMKCVAFVGETWKNKEFVRENRENPAEIKWIVLKFGNVILQFQWSFSALVFESKWRTVFYRFINTYVHDVVSDLRDLIGWDVVGKSQVIYRNVPWSAISNTDHPQKSLFEIHCHVQLPRMRMKIQIGKNFFSNYWNLSTAVDWVFK